MLRARTATIVLVVAVVGNGATCYEQPNDPSPLADVTLPGVDTRTLTPREKHEFSDYIRELPAPCSDVAVPVGLCVVEKRACAKCLPAARVVAKSVRDGLSREQIEENYRNRFEPIYVHTISVDGSPSRGPDNAPVVLIEFADFECPSCEKMAPILDAIWDKHQNELRMVYKFLPLSIHPHSEIAARAGFAAFQEGHFWEMHKKLFANRSHLERTDVEGYAQAIGLDLTKFRADMDSQAATDALARDRKQADELMVKSTPTIYINGHEYDWRGDVADWITTELVK